MTNDNKGLGASASPPRPAGAGFTPGPWKVVWPDDGYGFVIEANDETIAYLDNIKGPRTAANARLIRAAPDLREALERIAEMTDIEADFDGFEARTIARAALAKATGDHP
jgi:hypothetical protein